MSREKECKCCHEWWYASDVKENLCPNCYDYFKQLKRQLKEKDNLIEFGREEIRKRNKRIDEIVERDKKLFDDKNKELEKLKQQLEEKDKEIERLNKALEMCKHIERYDIGEMFLENAKLIIEKRQFAIRELEKVNKYADEDFRKHCYIDAVQLEKFINQQIKDLKGE